MDKFVASEIIESKRAKAYLNGEDISGSPLWHCPGVPTFYGSLVLAEMFGIEAVGEGIRPTTTPNGQRAFVACVVCQRSNTSRTGAAISRDKEVAKCLAMRNAIRQLIPQAGVNLVWRDTLANAQRKHA